MVDERRKMCDAGAWSAVFLVCIEETMMFERMLTPGGVFHSEQLDAIG